MRGVRAMLIAAIVLGIAGVAGAAGPMTLTRDGDLYSVASVDNQVVVTARYADGTVEELFVPQSAAAVDDSLQVDVDEVTGSLIVLWQKLSGMDAKVRLAAFVDGTWIGPRTLAGHDGTAAQNPQLLVHRARTVLVEGPDGDPVKTVIETAFIHAVWWSKQSEEDTGSAYYASVPLDADGTPLFSQISETVLSDLLPYGAACFDIESAEALEQPKLFIDPQSGNPHVFLTDYEGCAFQIMELLPEVVEDIEFEKRRRQIIILRHAQTVTIRSNLPLRASKFAVGHGLVIVAYWDGEDSRVEYVHMDRTGISETKTLAVGETLSHEQATELIRGLTN